RPKRSLLKTLLVLLVIIVSILLICAAFLPTIISSKWGNDKLVALANQEIPGSISVEKISLSWLGPQELHGIILKDLQDETLLSLKKGGTPS
nr:hypothetical protein [Parachlamydiaceae bacterium]